MTRRRKSKTKSISGIYIITCLPTGDQYIGKSKDIVTRCAQHSSSLRKGNHVNSRLQRLYDIHGILSLEMKIVELLPKSKLSIAEWEWINKLNPSLNIMDRKLTRDEFLLLASLAAKGYHTKYISRKLALTPGYIKYLLSKYTP